MKQEVAKRIREASEMAQTLGYQPIEISVSEFLDYLTGETLTGDTTTPEEILTSDYLMLHEVVEISELKKRSIPVDKQTMKTHTVETYTAHLKATDVEFTYALKIGARGWLQKRLTIAQCWFDDPYLPLPLEPQYRALLKKYSRYLE